MYKITNIDLTTNAVYVTFTYNSHVLDHTIFVDDANNADLVTQACSDAYDQFKSEMDIIDSAPVLTQGVQDLIGVDQEVS